MNIYSIFDNVAEKWLPIWEAENHATAIRNCRNSWKDNNSNLKDFDLNWIGKVENGIIETVDGYSLGNFEELFKIQVVKKDEK